MTELISYLQLIQKYLYQIGGPILISIGTIGCVLNLIFFNTKVHRKNPCSIYLTAYNLANLLLIYGSLLPITLTNGYGTNFSMYNLIACRAIIYMALIGIILPPSYLILAYVDRIFITSSNALTRQRSTRRRAYISIIAITLFWAVLHSHAFFLVNIFQLAPNYYSCYFTAGIYFTLMAYYSLIIAALLVPFSLIVLGLWTLKNLRSIRHVRVAPNTAPLRIIQPKERQFVRILFVDTSGLTVFTLLLSIVIMYQQITQYNQKSAVQNQIELFTRFLTNLIFYIPFCVGCYTNCIASKTFRKEIQKILFCE